MYYFCNMFAANGYNTDRSKYEIFGDKMQSLQEYKMNLFIFGMQFPSKKMKYFLDLINEHGN